MGKTVPALPQKSFRSGETIRTLYLDYLYGGTTLLTCNCGLERNEIWDLLANLSQAGPELAVRVSEALANPAFKNGQKVSIMTSSEAKGCYIHRTVTVRTEQILLKSRKIC